MKATCIRYHQFGDPQDVLQVEQTDVQGAGAGEVLVRMIVRPINPSDLIPVRGAYAHRISLPAVPGYEGVGIVEEVGPGVPKWLLGKRILPLRGEGTWQAYVKTAAQLAVPVPDGIDDLTAAQLYINPLTAWLTCTEVLQLGAEDVLLINAGGSSLGRIFAQLSNILGFRLIAVTRSNACTEELIRLGASAVINAAPLRDTVMELTNGRGASAAVDSVGGIAGAELACCLRPQGIVLSIGLLSGIPVDWATIARRANVRVKLFHLRHWNQQASVQTWHQTFHRVMELVSSQKVRLGTSGARFPLEEVKAAVRLADSPGAHGKILMEGAGTAAR
ncbi:zinc-dependent alcohol dehydrogenase family protein [Brevibacillus massiliensis]|uniref:zinc-dependent alcohol dehydrogenase family protein n=1 Tax=Brevibacillus massiliensis TaxID=1118054 RepID=UPI0002DE16C6|nr:zinc-dependent alcohol dehydrogenase family protein [Brevibacillus massiliensis]